MTSAEGVRKPVRRWWLSHGVAILAGGILATLLTSRSLESAGKMGRTFEHEPFEHAVSFAYAWGSAADASVLLDRYAARLRGNPNWEPLAGSGELAFTEFRRAIIERRSVEEITELCRTTPRCNPDKIDALISKLSAARRVADPL